MQHVGHKIKGFYRLADYAPRWGMTTSAMCTGPIHWIDPNRPAALYLLAQSRGGAVWQLVGLITRRSKVQILPPQPNNQGLAAMQALSICGL